MLNQKLWNQEQYERSFQLQPEVRRIAQSKGLCNMVICPKKGDYVAFVLKGKIVMKGYVDSDGFEEGSNHKLHSCNIGDIREHTNSNKFAWVIITEVGLSQDIRKTGQRTWAKMPI